jgi:hypothetical protein
VIIAYDRRFPLPFLFVMILVLSGCAGQRDPRTNPFALNGMVQESPSEGYGVVVAHLNSEWPDTTVMRFVPFDAATGKSMKVKSTPETQDTDAATEDAPAAILDDETPAPVTEANPYGGVVHDAFDLVPVDQPYQVIALKPGHYMIDTITLRSEWEAKGGLHNVSLKPMYGGFQVNAGELLYLGDINVATDRSGYKHSSTMNQASTGLEMLIGTIVYMATPTFGDDDVALGVVDKTTEAKTYVKTTYPKLNRDMIYRPLELGYYAGQNHGG